MLSNTWNNNRSVILLIKPKNNSLNSLISYLEDFDFDEWMEQQIHDWPNIETDLQFEFDYESFEFVSCIAYFSFWKWQIDLQPTCFPENGKYTYYAPEITIQLGDT